jgi:CIC family chloride channel protein
MVVEMVGSITILIPAMAAVAVSTLLKGEKTIFHEQVPTKAQSGAHRGEFDQKILKNIFVRDAMISGDSLVTLSPHDDIKRVLELIDTTRHHGFPVIDNGKFVGIITSHDVHNIPLTDQKCPIVGDLMISEPLVVSPETSLEEALTIIIDRNVHHLPVVKKESPDQLIGFLTRYDILKAYLRSGSPDNCQT